MARSSPPAGAFANKVVWVVGASQVRHRAGCSCAHAAPQAGLAAAAAVQGLGERLAQLLAKSGALLVLTSRSAERLQVARPTSLAVPCAAAHAPHLAHRARCGSHSMGQPPHPAHPCQGAARTSRSGCPGPWHRKPWCGHLTSPVRQTSWQRPWQRWSGTSRRCGPSRASTAS